MKRSILYILATAFALYAVLIFNYTMDPKLDLNGDNAVYIQLARSMADGNGYGSISADGTFTPANHFPPGYSTILSIAVWMGIDTLLGFKIINAIFLILSMAGLIYIVSCITRQTYMTFAIATLTLLCPVLMHFAGIVMSEMSYMFFTVLTLLALYQYSLRGGENATSQWSFLRSPWFYVAIVAAIISYHIRSVGAAAIAAIIIFFLFRKEWVAAAGSTVGMVALMLPWMIRNKMWGLEGRYLDTIMVVNPWRPEEGNISSFSDFFHKILVNLDETVIKGFKEMLFPFMQINYQQTSSIIAIIGGIALVAIIFYGAWRMGRLRWAMMTFLAANIGLFALWHGGNGSRYVTPIVPMLYFCFYTGVYGLVQLAVKNRIKEHSPWLVALLLMALPMIAPIKQQHQIAKQPYPIQYQQYFAIAEELNKRPETIGKIVCCRKPELFKFYAPRLNTARYLYTTNAEELLDDLAAKNVDFIIVDQLGYSSTPRYLMPAVQKYNHCFPVVWHLEQPDTYLLRFDRNAYSIK